MFDALISGIGLWGLAFAFAVMALAGFVKGVVGFALPMVSVSGLGSGLPPVYAIAGLLLPALLTNIWQALRDGWEEALNTFLSWWRYTLVIVVVIGCVAPFVAIMSPALLFLILGIGVTFFATLQLTGWSPSSAMMASPWAERISAVLAGIFGGLAAVTGPPVVMYLLARDVRKAEQVRLQGIIFFLGLAVLVLIHGQTGVLNANTSVFSALLILPAFGGMALGLMVQDRMPQATFKKATLVVLVVAGLNLLRRGIAAL
jgi:uncharacterized membrane protein YfcA